MTFQQLQYFLEVYKAGSFSEAAKRQFVSTSGLSIAISNLEKELGSPLFIRTQKGLEVTTFGNKVLERATQICEQHRQLSRISNEEVRSFRIAAIEYPPCADAFARLMKELGSQLNANIAISSTSDVTLQKLFLCELDMAIIGNFHARQLPLFEELEEKKLEYKLLQTVPVEIVIGPKHRLYNQETIGPEDLSQEIFLDNVYRFFSRNHYLKGILSIAKDNVIAVHKSEVLYRLLDEGVGYTIFLRPQPDVCETHNFRRIPLENVFYDIIFVTNPIRPLCAMGQRYLSLVEEEIAAAEQREA